MGYWGYLGDNAARHHGELKMDDMEKLFIGFFGVCILLVSSLMALSFYGDKYDCYDKAEKLGVEAEWSINNWGYVHCIYTLENGKKIESTDYKYTMIEELKGDET